MPRRAKSTPAKGAAAGKRYPLNMRTTFKLRKKLEESARASGLSLAQEVERRVEHSFAEQAFEERMRAAAGSYDEKYAINARGSARGVEKKIIAALAEYDRKLAPGKPRGRP